MHQLRLQTIAILSLVFCGSAAAFQETPDVSTNPTATVPSTSSKFEPYYDKLKQDSARSSQLSQASNERVVGGDTIIIAWSEKLDELRGFSAKIGDWEVLKIPPQKSIVPKVAKFVAVVLLGCH